MNNQIQKIDTEEALFDIRLQIDNERKKQKMTRKTLAAKAGLNTATLRRFLNGDKSLTMRSFTAIALALDLDVIIKPLRKNG